MLQNSSDDFFQQPLIFYGTLEQEDEDEPEFQINWDPIFPFLISQQELPSTGLFFHWAEMID